MNSMRTDTELRNVHYLRKGDNMSIKGKQIGRLKNWVNKLEAELADEKQKAEGYEEIARVHNAYIAFLLHKLGATEEAPVVIRGEDIKHALEHLETRVLVGEAGVWKFFCDEVE